MVYAILRVLMKFTLRAFYRRVYISGAEKIPKTGPVMLACNHPSAFMDAVVLCVLLDRPLHFLTRSDMFSTPLNRWLLGLVNMLPIYRQQEGKENLHKNEEIFNKCYDMIAKGAVVSIFSEGNCVQEKRLRNLKKGTARLAFGAEEKFKWNLEVKIVPVGINYTYPARFREELIISIGDPIEPKTCKELYDENPAKGTNAFNAKLYRSLSNEVIRLNDKKKEQTFEKIIPLIRSNTKLGFGKWLIRGRQRLDIEQQVAQSVNKRSDHDDDILNLQEYTDTIDLLGLTDQAVVDAQEKPYRSILFLLLTSPIALIGYLINFAPIFFGLRTSQKKVREIEFYTSVAMAVMFFSYLLYYVILLLIGGLSYGFIGFLIAAGAPLYGLLALHWIRNWANLKNLSRAKKVLKRNKVEFHQLLKKRQEIIRKFY